MLTVFGRLLDERETLLRLNISSNLPCLYQSWTHKNGLCSTVDNDPLDVLHVTEECCEIMASVDDWEISAHLHWFAECVVTMLLCHKEDQCTGSIWEINDPDLCIDFSLVSWRDICMEFEFILHVVKDVQEKPLWWILWHKM